MFDSQITSASFSFVYVLFIPLNIDIFFMILSNKVLNIWKYNWHKAELESTKCSISWQDFIAMVYI